MRKLLSLFLITVIGLMCLTGCAAQMKSSGDYYTDYEGVYITIDEIDYTQDKSPVIKVVWHNESDSYIAFGLGYTLEYLDGEEWKNVQIVDFAIPEIACTLEGGKVVTQNYSTKYFNTLRPDTYRIRTEFYVLDKNVGSKSTFATFEVYYL